jgi:hypothetical protein
MATFSGAPGCDATSAARNRSSTRSLIVAMGRSLSD